MLTFVLPTRNRPQELANTLAAIDALGLGNAEVIIADNASEPAASVPPVLAGGTPVRLVRRERNEAAAARNGCVALASHDSEWVIMLDDDSAPIDGGFVAALAEQPADVAAVAAEIVLPTEQGGVTRRESGGLPEVFIGCGVAIRTRVFIELGGYDYRFDYYAEEYDLAARMIAAGYRVAFDRRFRVLHRKVTANRDFGRIIRRLVRNNAWVAQRYAPDSQRRSALSETISRYARIARKEQAIRGYLRGVADLTFSLPAQPRRALSQEQYDRFTGLAAARAELLRAHQERPLGRVALVHHGKNAGCVQRALAELGLAAIAEPDEADTLVIATMSPGPMLDALEALSSSGVDGPRIVAPWEGANLPATAGIVARISAAA